MNELWLAIEGHPNYEISNLGRVRSLRRTVRIGAAKRTVRETILKTWVSIRTGYTCVGIDRKTISVHRLVCAAFVPREPGREWVNHKNGKRDDPRAENLEWCTPSENMLHAIHVLKSPGRTPYKGKFGKDHNTSKAVRRVDMATGESVVYEAAYHARHEGFDSGCISKCCNGLLSQHKGNRWEFA